MDDDAGLIPYLTFYYCGFSEFKGLAFILLVVWLGLLFTTIGIAASDFFSINLSTIANIMGLSESLAGVTFLAFGNGSPDVFSTFAAMNSNSASMAVGELIGAASFITGVVAGSMALVREFRVDKKTYGRDICFFIVAVAFTMIFLADGNLRFWECWIMIGYYLIYVFTVVGQHWYTTRRKRRLRREGEARSHVYGPVGTSVDELAGEPYRDDPDDVDQHHGSGRAEADVSALEYGPRIEVDGIPATDAEAVDEEDEEDHERLVAAEVTSSMRVLRTRGKRSNTINPIRPSLVGALEFRSALAQLQRESNLKMSPINGHGRSLSEAYIHDRTRRRTTGGRSVADPPTPHTIAAPDEVTLGRARALSSGNEPTSRALPQELLGPPPDPNAPRQDHFGPGWRSSSPAPSFTIGGNLAPPPVGTPQPSSVSISPMTGHPQSNAETPNLHLQIPGSQSSHSGGSSPSSPFPVYTDSPAALTPFPQGEQAEFMLPGPAQRDHPFADLLVHVDNPRPVRWWPYSILPPPHVLYATLFPTLQGWRDKTIWDKLVSTISIPSIFLLVVTLPVVENVTTEEDSVVDTMVDPLPLGTRQASHVAASISAEPHGHERESEWERYRRRTLSRNNSYHVVQPSTPPLVSLEGEDTLVGPPNQAMLEPQSPVNRKPVSEVPSVSNANDETVPWNRWLVCLQLFTGPLFSVFILWANMYEDYESPGRTFVNMVLYTLLGSLILLAALLLFTTEHTKPKYHYFLCFLGFVISVAWISTVAGEVVGVLKTFGVILGISEALLGLTIFAAGNSVGDLVADITVARLGYPVMAL